MEGWYGEGSDEVPALEDIESLLFGVVSCIPCIALAFVLSIC